MTSHWDEEEEVELGVSRLPKQQMLAKSNVAEEKMMEATKGDFDVLDAMTVMRELLVKDLMERLRSGTATHQELAVMTRLLKDNGLTLMPYPDSAPIENRPLLGPGPFNQEGGPMETIGFPRVIELPKFGDEEEER